jgi:hypothetical protein
MFMLDIHSLFSYPLNASSTSVQLVNAPGDMLVELDSLNRFVHGVLEYQ